MDRSYYSSSIEAFCATPPDQVLGEMVRRHGFDLNESQRDAWLEQTRIEFKVGEKRFLAADLDQVVDYALDLRNFHEGSHEATVAPILVATEARSRGGLSYSANKLFAPIKTDAAGLRAVMDDILRRVSEKPLDSTSWEGSRYHPTPTIIEAALALYGGHSVTEISRSDAGAINLSLTSTTLSRIIESSRRESRKSICFVTGVPGAGKTLVGLNIATTHINTKDELHRGGRDRRVGRIAETLVPELANLRVGSADG